ncbi:MAG: hypothetical protein FWG65_03995 [Turicibacter sp.]|nr:hypothetical protein [Turicibacter sp.]
MYSDLSLFLENAAFDRARVEVVTTDGDNFTGISDWINESFDDDLGWDFDDVEGVSYQALPFGDIARVRLVGATAWAWEYDKARTAPTRELELAAV